MAENSTKAAKKPKRKRGPGRPFQKGQSGNPGGRPKGIVARVKALIGEDGGDMLRILDGMARGTLTVKQRSFLTGEEYDVVPGFKERREAAQALLDRGFGKAAQPLTGEDGEGPVRVVIHKEPAP